MSVVTDTSRNVVETEKPSGDRGRDRLLGGDGPMTRVGPIGRLGRYMATHFGSCSSRWLARRGRARVLRTARRERALRRRLGGNRLAVGAGAAADRPQDFHGLSSYALMTVLYSPTKTVNDPAFRAVIAGVERTLRADGAVSTVVAPTAGVSISRDGHTAIVQAGAARDSNAMVAAADRLKGKLAALSSRRRAGEPDRRVGDVVGLQRREPLGDAQVRGDLLAGDAADHAARVRLAGRGRAAADADDDRPARGRRLAVPRPPRCMPISIWAMNFALMFALALGIDYALFVVHRFRGAFFGSRAVRRARRSR